MKNALIVTVALLGIAVQASALDINAITEKPTADNPQFDKKEAWPDLVGDEYFPKEEWPTARLLIFAHAATTPTRGEPRPDIADAASWIDAATGRPAEAVPDMDTDVILPDAERPYSVSGRGFICRHLTVGRKADFQPGGGRAAEIFGNVWIRPGGIFYVYRTLKLVGGRDARIGVGYCNWMNLSFPDQRVSRRGHPCDYGRFSALVRTRPAHRSAHAGKGIHFDVVASREGDRPTWAVFFP